jgi:protein involved in polysaccharide export with SLBB domain
MKTLLFLVLAILCQLPSLTLLANEPVFTAGQSFSLRIAGVPPADAAGMNGMFTISDAGKLKLPFLKNELRAVGLTPTALQKLIAQAFIDGEIYSHPSVMISIIGDHGRDQQVITVGGEVKQPGDIAYRPGINLYAAINKASGPTEFAQMGRIKLIRGKTERVIDLRKVTAENNILLEAGDQIVVP